MRLKDWLAAKEIDFRMFGEMIDRTAEAVRRYANGERIPDRDTMPKIFSVTDGAVTANDFYEIGAAADHDAADTTGITPSSPGKAGEISAAAVPA